MRGQKRGKISINKYVVVILALSIGILFMSSSKSYHVYAATTEETPFPIGFDLTVGTGESDQVVSSLQILFLLTIISLAPSILVMLTSFTRVVVVLHFVRSALGTQQTPPNQVLIGLALFLTLFIMTPVISNVNSNALQPYSNGEITQEEAIDRGLSPIREFMFKQVNDKDLALFIEISQVENIDTQDDIPTATLIPAFIISELRTAFIIGFLIYIPFIVIDMIVASTLMSMGMMMLPPVMISMPFKLLLFILADGWSLVIGELVKTFHL